MASFEYLCKGLTQKMVKFHDKKEAPCRMYHPVPHSDKHCRHELEAQTDPSHTQQLVVSFQQESGQPVPFLKLAGLSKEAQTFFLLRK